MTTEPTRVRDPAGTRRLVLDAAERLFAERGFAGTSIRDIAQASGVSHPLIQHHFATKEGLYRSVLRRCADEYGERFPEAKSEVDRPVDLRAEMTRLFGFVRDHPRLMRMVGWARLEGRVDLFSEKDHKPRDAMIRRIEAAQRAGSVRDDIPAPVLATMLEALLFSYLENRPIAPAGGGPVDADTYLELAIRLFERGAGPGGQ